MSDLITKESENVESKNNNSMVNPELLLMTAIEKGLPIETIEKLLQLRTQLKNEWAKEQYENAMAKFQGECPIIQKIKEGGKTNSGVAAYDYAPVEEMVLQTKDLMVKNGFNYDFQPETLENKIKVTCNVNHISGFSKSKTVEFPLITKTNVMSLPQVVAGTMTFAMRYAFRFSFGIVTGECEDLMNEDNDDKINLQDIKDEIKRNKPEYINPNEVKQKESNREKIIKEAGKIILPLNKDDLKHFRTEFDYYLKMRNSKIELTDEEYEAELNILMELENKIKQLHTGAVNDADPIDVEFHLENKEIKLPKGVL